MAWEEEGVEVEAPAGDDNRRRRRWKRRKWNLWMAQQP
jgi:hypothetical protein